MLDIVWAIVAAVGLRGWGANPLERLAKPVAVTLLLIVWGVGGLTSLVGVYGSPWTKTPRDFDERFPILQSGSPPVPWWVLQAFSSLAAFPCLFPRYLNLIWAERTSKALGILHWSLLTGAVCLSVFLGHAGFAMFMGWTPGPRVIFIVALMVCACCLVSAPLLAGITGASRFQAVSLVVFLLAVAAASSIRSAENLMVNANRDWSEFGTPRTTVRRSQVLESRRQYTALGGMAYTLLAAMILQLTAVYYGDIAFPCVTAIAALTTAAFYQTCVPHSVMGALEETSNHTTPRPTTREPRQSPGVGIRSKGARLAGVGLAHAFHGANSALGTLLFALHAMQVLGIPIWVIGVSHASAYGSEWVLLRYDNAIHARLGARILWVWGVTSSSARLLLYTLVTRENGAWLLPLVEVTHGATCCVASCAAARLLRRRERPSTSLVPAALLGDGNLAQAFGCVLWGFVWHRFGFSTAFYAAAILGVAAGGLAGIACILPKRDNGDECPEDLP